ncbi:MAG: glycoside hydrolase, partial [Acidobacteriota bacterium]|nr:glycoside hydrolase [Acidobacteriota bacterium]
SPDLTRKTWEAPPSIGKYRDNATAKPTQRGVIYAVGASPHDGRLIWAGTDDGLIHLTIDGGLHWRDVTPPQLMPFAKVSIIEAGHFDRNTAYAAINTLRLDDMRPHILRTHDGGKSWTEIINGIPDGAPVNVVREDPQRNGLLFAGTEREVYISFDDGDHWQSLRLNMPATSIRDVIVKDDDLVAATHGRGFWILDDVTPFRQIEAPVAAGSAFLFKPQTAVRVRWSMNTDTPLPPDEPAGKNPPDGAIIDYYVGGDASGPLTLEIVDGAGRVIRRYSSDDPVEPLDPMLAIPAYWVRPPLTLSSEPGMHRFLWDIHYAPLTRARSNYPMQAVFQDTPPAQTSLWAMPGKYTVKLTLNGRSYAQPLTVKMDPRVHTPTAGLLKQFTLSKQLYDDSVAATKALEEIRAWRAQRPQDKEASLIEGAAVVGRGGRGAAPGPDTVTSVNTTLGALMQSIQEADVAPNTATIAAVAERRAALAKLLQRWNTLKGR